MKGIIITIIILIALYVLVFFALTFKKIYVKHTFIREEDETETTYQKRVFSFEAMTVSFVVSRLIWALIGVVMLVYAFTLIMPIFWMLYTSVKGHIAYIDSTFALPQLNDLHFENYRHAIERLEITEGIYTYGLDDMLFNSFFAAIVGPLTGVFWTTLVAYIMSRFRFIGNRLLYNLGILLMMIPIVGNTASTMIIYKQWGLYDNLYVMTLIPPSTAFSGMNFLVIYGALKAIPLTYSEAAYLDGASEYTVMFRIIIPMVIPTCATFYLLGFIASWNSYESYLIWYPSTPNLSYGMYKYTHSATTGAGALSMPEILAGLTFATIPSTVLYLSFQKIIRSKLTVGGLKG